MCLGNSCRNWVVYSFFFFFGVSFLFGGMEKKEEPTMEEKEHRMKADTDRFHQDYTRF